MNRLKHIVTYRKGPHVSIISRRSTVMYGVSMKGPNYETLVWYYNLKNARKAAHHFIAFKPKKVPE